MEISKMILQKGRLNPTNGAGDQVVKANGRADMEGTRNVMQAERRSTTRFLRQAGGQCSHHLYHLYESLFASTTLIPFFFKSSGLQKSVSAGQRVKTA